jgi:hypothetical protein
MPIIAKKIAAITIRARDILSSKVIRSSSVKLSIREIISIDLS